MFKVTLTGLKVNFRVRLPQVPLPFPTIYRALTSTFPRFVFKPLTIGKTVALSVRILTKFAHFPNGGLGLESLFANTKPTHFLLELHGSNKTTT